MNIVKQKPRNRLTNAHMDCLRRIATSDYTFRINSVKDKKRHFAHPTTEVTLNMGDVM